MVPHESHRAQEVHAGASTYLHKLACWIQRNTLISSFRRLLPTKEPESRCLFHLKKSSGPRGDGLELFTRTYTSKY